MNRHISTTMNDAEAKTGICSVVCATVFIIALVVAHIVLFVYYCLALTHSDSDVFYDACGSRLRTYMIVTITAPFVAVACISCCGLFCCYTSDAFDQFTRIVSNVCSLVVAVMYGLVIDECVKALNNQRCMDAMRTDSISAGTGSPLIAWIGLVASANYFVGLAIYLMKAPRRKDARSMAQHT
jgi:ABC-type Fe3+ transport system permease subunit